MKVAITSNDGRSVDTHFGKAERVLIYKISEKSVRLEEIRNIQQYCGNNPDHEFDADKFEAVFSMISDCKKIYTQKIGEKPASKLLERGIVPFVTNGEIESIKDLKDKSFV